MVFTVTHTFGTKEQVRSVPSTIIGPIVKVSMNRSSDEGTFTDYKATRKERVTQNLWTNNGTTNR